MGKVLRQRNLFTSSHFILFAVNHDYGSSFQYLNKGVNWDGVGFQLLAFLESKH